MAQETMLSDTVEHLHYNFDGVRDPRHSHLHMTATPDPSEHDDERQ